MILIFNAVLNIALLIGVYLEAGIYSSLLGIFLSVSIWCHHYRIKD
jgi:hypothetical protein